MRLALGVTLLLGPLFGASTALGQVFVRPIIGGVPASSGLAGGVEFIRYRTVGPLDLRFRAIGSTQKYEHFELALEAPPPATHDFFAEFRLRYRNYPEEDFWGLGPASPESRRSSYRMEDLNATASIGIHTRSGFRVAMTGGVLNNNTGPGQDRDLPSVEAVFVASEVPALDSQPDYWHAGLDFEVDRRANRTLPRSGYRMLFGWDAFRNVSGGDFSFNRFEFEHQHFFPVGRRHRIGGRARLILIKPFEGHEVPFFLHPNLGGINSVRGFQQYRFRDRNALVLNVEYHHQLYAFLDGVVFADAGRVFRKASDLNFDHVQGAAGLGARVRFGQRIFFGFDVGVSREGPQLWLRASQMF
jgi:outer membrane protein assembly factor BamA